MIRTLVIGFGMAVALSGCDKAAECKAKTDKVYQEKMAKCTDDACKKAAEKEKSDYYEGCEK